MATIKPRIVIYGPGIQELHKLGPLKHTALEIRDAEAAI